MTRLIEMHQRGVTLTDMAEALGRTHSSVWEKVRLLKRKGVLQSRKQPLISKDDEEMTKRQKEVLDFIRAFWAEHGYAPSYQVIAEGVGMKSKGGVARLVQSLEEGGHITRRPNRARSVRPAVVGAQD